MPDDKDETLAYYAQVLQDIRDIKARPWNFITILVVITGGVLALDNARLESLRGLLLFGIVVAAVATVCISIQSFGKLKRWRNDPLLKAKLPPPIWGDLKHRDHDWGDSMFLILGILAPILAVLLAFCGLYASPTCTWLLCV